MKNKIISILCIIVLLSFIFINNSFATETLPSVDYLLGNNDKFLIFHSPVTDVTVLVIYDGEITYTGNYLFQYEDGKSPDYISNYTYTSNSNLLIRNGTTFKFLKLIDNEWVYYDGYPASYSLAGFGFNFDIPSNALASNFDLRNNSVIFGNNNVVLNEIPIEPIIVYPGIANTAEDLSTGTFDYILVSPGTFSNSENIGLNIYNITNLEDDADVYSQKPLFSTTLNSSSSYYNAIVVEDQTEFWFEIPRANLNIDFKNGNTYLYSLTLDGSPIQEVQATIGGLTEEDILNNNFDNLQTSIKESNKEVKDSIDKQTEVLEETNKTNKNIFEKIGEILSYLNPFSENFFAYKLVELIIDGLKSLFVPSDDFFSNWLDDLNEYFGDTFGILYYPFELLVDFLNRIDGIAETNTAVISVPSFTLSFMDYSATFFEDMSYDLNSILENDTFKNIHDIYLIFTDIILWLGVIYLAAKMLRSIFGGMGDEVQSRVEESQEGERSYERYKQYQENKKRYKQENKGR